MNQIKEYSENTFESIRHIDEYGNEYWFAREQSKNIVDEHFTQVGKT